MLVPTFSGNLTDHAAKASFEDDSAWLQRLLINCCSYGIVLAPLSLLTWLSKRRFVRRYAKRGLLRWYVSGFRVSCDDGQKNNERSVAGKASTFCQLFWRFLFCFFGLQMSYVTWGVFQEKIMTQQYQRGADQIGTDRFGDSEFLVFCNRIISFVLGFIAALLLRRDTFFAPLHDFTYASVSNIVSSWCQYEALKFISFPTQMLGKSSKIVAVMLMGKLVQRRTYPVHEYLSAIVATVGIALFLLAGNGVAPRRISSASETTWSGFALMVGYLTLDSFTSNWQNALFNKYNISSLQMMAGVNFFSCLLSLFALFTQEQLTNAVLFIAEHPGFLQDLIIVSLCSTIGQFFIFYTIAQFGALMFTILMTVRQASSILVSCLLYKHRIGPTGIFGVVLVFLAIFTNALWKYVRLRPKSGQVAPV
ncbi:adenosine 3' phospho 5' phosphosulfate [Trichuris trichiura]|uniref:Adenosine 3'-phospho 5'-phosphosulfate transporter 1 n=1 Tax=Trichuris trichiura TaxID=36087 RepID=A0A077ZB04_TRITR|nr:adenosine 3' phospho 5' phosphosulfate [Trichuris trichiura]